MTIKYYAIVEKTKSGKESVIKITPNKQDAQDFFDMVDKARGGRESTFNPPLVKSKFQIVVLEKKVYWNRKNDK